MPQQYSRQRFPPQEFAQTDDAMGTLGFGEAEKAAVFRVLAALLHLGNVRFEVCYNRVRYNTIRYSIHLGNARLAAW